MAQASRALSSISGTPASAREMGLIRLSLMADHTPALLEEAAEALLKVFTDQDQLPAETDQPPA